MTQEDLDRNYRLLRMANLFFVVSMGFLAAIGLIRLRNDLDSMAFGIAAISLVAACPEVFTAIMVGKYCDRWGRKFFIMLSMFLTIVVACICLTLNQFGFIYAYLIFALVGAVFMMYITAEQALLADLTAGEDRGKKMGRYQARERIAIPAAATAGAYFDNISLLVVMTVACTAVALIIVAKIDPNVTRGS